MLLLSLCLPYPRAPISAFSLPCSSMSPVGFAVFTHSGPGLHLHIRSNSAEDSVSAPSCRLRRGPVVETTTTAAQHECQPLMMKRRGETKAAPRAADVDAGSCLLCGGVFCEVKVARFCASTIVCGCANTCTRFWCACVGARVGGCVHCISACCARVFVCVCQCCGPVAMKSPAERKSECIHPGSKGLGATQVPNEGMKGCSADVTRWGSVA